MFRDYFQQEKEQRKELGAEFAKKHPAIAPMLSGPVADPDVERLNEAVAFHTAMLRRKLDDDFPEIIQDLIRIVCPQYLRPTPAATTVAFAPIPALANPATIPAGSLISSVKVDDTQCQFSTCFDVEIYPLSILRALFDHPAGQAPHVKMEMELRGMRLSDWKVKTLRFFLSGEYAGASDIYYLLTRHLKSITIKPLEGGSSITLPGTCLKDAGFLDNSVLLPYPEHSFTGYRMIQEYFFMPEKYLYVDLNGLEHWRNRGSGSRFEIYFEFESLPLAPPRVNKDTFVLYATPVINIFKHQAEPIYYDQKKPWYLLRPVCTNPDNYQVFSVDKVSGKVKGSNNVRIYNPFEYFRRDMDDSPIYHTKFHQSPSRQDPDVYMSVHYPSGTMLEKETISIELKCTNGTLPESLRIGDINHNTGKVSQIATFRNIKPITPSISIPLGSNALWRMLSLMSLNYLSLQSARNLQSMLELYMFPERRDQLAVLANRKRISGIEDLEDRRAVSLLDGAIIRGREVNLQMRQDHYVSKGDMYIFGSVLDIFLSSYATINSFTMLNIKETLRGETYKWPMRLGSRYLA
jgi:type VI secretion system protein ImpG